MTPNDIERLANRRAKAKLGWYIHAVVYLTVNALLFFLSAHGEGRHHWSIYPALGWGLGLALHGISVFVLGASGGLRERMVQKERERLQRRQRDGS